MMTPVHGDCGKVLVVGGIDPGYPASGRSARVPSDSAELFDPAATDPATGRPGLWTPTGSPASGYAFHTAVQLPTDPAQGCGVNCGKVLVMGGPKFGFSAGDPPPDLYDPRTGTWTPACADRRSGAASRPRPFFPTATCS